MLNIHCAGQLQDKHMCDVRPNMCELRKTNAWFLKVLLQYDPSKQRAPSKQECIIILESLNAKSKASMNHDLQPFSNGVCSLRT